MPVELERPVNPGSGNHAGTAHLDVLRALAAFWVMTSHCIIWGGALHSIPFPDPKIAVDIFMLISGFLMASTLTSRADREPFAAPVTWLRFLTRRVFRLAPLYYAVLLFVVLLQSRYLGGYAVLRALNPAQWGDDTVYNPAYVHYGVTNLLWHVSFLFGLHPIYAFSTFLPDWSLGLEMQFYVVVPFILLAMRRLGPGRTAVVLAIAALIGTHGVNIAVQHGWMPRFREPSLLLFRLPIFLAGILAFEASPARIPSWQRRTLLIGLAALLVMTMLPAYGPEVLLLELALTCIVVFNGADAGQTGAIGVSVTDISSKLVNPAGRVQRSRPVAAVLHSRIVMFAADVSYSVYLLHGLVLSLLGSIVGRAAAVHGISQAGVAAAIWVAVVPTTYILSGVSYRLLERPFISLGARLARRLPDVGRHRSDPDNRMALTL
ncbi:MAG TPA: acyltransferase [Rhodopila sp.]|nr:acyltransferase [Rhodopila sp.]